MTFRLVVRCLNQLHHYVPPNCTVHTIIHNMTILLDYLYLQGCIPEETDDFLQ